jgi:hypothetical protein
MRIQLAVPWTDDKNVDHRAGTKLNVTPDVAHQLIKDGFAAAVGVGEDDEPVAPPTAQQNYPPAHSTSPSKGDDQKGAGDGRS